MAPRWLKVFQEESLGASLLPFDLNHTPYPSSPSGDQLKSLHVSSLYWYLGVTTERATHCGLKATGIWPLPVPEARKLVKYRKGKRTNGGALQDPPTSSYFQRSWILACGTLGSASTIIWPFSVSLGPVSSPVISIAAPGYLAPFILHLQRCYS